MKVQASNVTFAPEIDGAIKRRIVTLALQQVAQRVSAVQSNLRDLAIDSMAVDMPIPLEQVKSGYYTEKAAADFLANRIFKALLPNLQPGARNEDLLQRAKVYGAENGFKRVGGPPITIDYLRSVGLTPKWSFETTGVRYHMSDPIQVGSRVAYVAFVEQGGEVHTRVFYGSQSQGVWRAASHRVEGASHLGISERWIGKGNPHEESTDLPYELYGELNRRAASPRTDIAGEGAEGVFYGLLEVKSFDDFMSGNQHPTEGFFPGEASQLGSFGANVDKFGKPESFRFNDPKDAPDFTKLLSTFDTPSSVYGGSVSAFAFPSKNGKLAYLFYKDADGRAWLASVQDTTSMVTSRGGRRQIIDAGNLSMPLYEYRDQIPAEYRGRANPRDGAYYDAWEYVKRLPIISDLYQAQGWAMPGGDPARALVPLRPRTFAVGDYVRVARSGGVISWGQVVGITGDQATVQVPAAGGQVGTKVVPVSGLMPCYRVNEQVNVPRSSGPPCAGVITHAEADDTFVCAFLDHASGQQATKHVSGKELDRVNFAGHASGTAVDAAAPGGEVIRPKLLQVSATSGAEHLQRKTIEGLVRAKLAGGLVNYRNQGLLNKIAHRPERVRDAGASGAAIQREPMSAEAKEAAQEILASVRHVQYEVQTSRAYGQTLMAFMRAIRAQLKRLGVGYKDTGGFGVTIDPAPGKAALNQHAARLKTQLGVTLVFDAAERFKKDDFSLAYYRPGQRLIQSDVDSIVQGDASDTLVHEIHHAFMDRDRNRGHHTFLNLSLKAEGKESSLPGSEKYFYSDYLSVEELATWSRQLRHIAEPHLKVERGDGSLVWTATARDSILRQLGGLTTILGTLRHNTDALVGKLEAIASGQDTTTPVEHKGDAMTVTLDGYSLTLKGRKRGLAGFLKGLATPAAERRLVAEELAMRVREAGQATQIVQLVVEGIDRELKSLTDGQVIPPAGVVALRQMMHWPFYVVRVAVGRNLEHTERQGELAKLLELARDFSQAAGSI